MFGTQSLETSGRLEWRERKSLFVTERKTKGRVSGENYNKGQVTTLFKKLFLILSELIRGLSVGLGKTQAHRGQGTPPVGVGLTQVQSAMFQPLLGLIKFILDMTQSGA